MKIAFQASIIFESVEHNTIYPGKAHNQKKARILTLDTVYKKIRENKFKVEVVSNALSVNSMPVIIIKA